MTDIDVGYLSEAINDKMDRDVHNIDSVIGSPLVAELGMPNNEVFEELTLGTGGSTYIAPANGYFYVHKAPAATGQYIVMLNQTGGADGLCAEYQPNNASNHARIWLPVKKGDVIEINYSLSGTTYEFRFFYAVGSESEAS